MSPLDQPSTAPDRLVAFWHDDLTADDPVDVIEDGGRVFLALSPHADRDDLTREISYRLTVYLRSSWLYVGTSEESAP